MLSRISAFIATCPNINSRVRNFTQLINIQLEALKGARGTPDVTCNNVLDSTNAALRKAFEDNLAAILRRSFALLQSFAPIGNYRNSDTRALAALQACYNDGMEIFSSLEQASETKLQNFMPVFFMFETNIEQLSATVLAQQAMGNFVVPMQPQVVYLRPNTTPMLTPLGIPTSSGMVLVPGPHGMHAVPAYSVNSLGESR